MSEINQKIAELKKQMYDLEIEAETFQIKSRIVPMYSFYSKQKVYLIDEKLALEAYHKRTEARKINNQIKKLESKLKLKPENNSGFYF